MEKFIDIQVVESEKELKSILRRTKSRVVAQRIEALLLVKQAKCKYTLDVSVKVGKTRKTIYNWFKTYKEKGIDGLCEVKKGG